MNRLTQIARVGRRWDLDAHVEVLKEQRRRAKDARRGMIAVGILLAIVVGVTGLGWLGLESGNFTLLAGFWTAAGPIFGAIMVHYFGKDADDG